METGDASGARLVCGGRWEVWRLAALRQAPPQCVRADHLRRQLEGLLNEHEVDLVLSGHVHSYARTCNVLGGKCIDMDSGG